MDGKTLRKGKF